MLAVNMDLIMVGGGVLIYWNRENKQKVKYKFLQMYKVNNKLFGITMFLESLQCNRKHEKGCFMNAIYAKNESYGTRKKEDFSIHIYSCLRAGKNQFFGNSLNT